MQPRIYKKPSSLRHLIKVAATRTILKDAGAHNDLFGHKVAIFAHDLVGISINSYGIYERDLLDALFGFLAPLEETFVAGLALDIGANIGNHSMFFARRFAKVYAFEPNPSTYPLLVFNSGHYANIRTFDFALGARLGTALLQDVQGNTGASSLCRGIGGAHQQTHHVTIKALDDTGLDLTDLCFVKIDVEGFEINAIEGARNAISEQMPIIAFEQHETDFDGGRSAAVEALREIGYFFVWNREAVQKRTVLKRLRNLIKGHEIALVSGTTVPPGHHELIVAIPHRFQKVLGL